MTRWEFLHPDTRWPCIAEWDDNILTVVPDPDHRSQDDDDSPWFDLTLFDDTMTAISQAGLQRTALSSIENCRRELHDALHLDRDAIQRCERTKR